MSTYTRSFFIQLNQQCYFSPHWFCKSADLQPIIYAPSQRKKKGKGKEKLHKKKLSHTFFIGKLLPSIQL